MKRYLVFVGTEDSDKGWQSFYKDAGSAAEAFKDIIGLDIEVKWSQIVDTRTGLFVFNSEEGE